MFLLYNFSLTSFYVKGSRIARRSVTLVLPISGLDYGPKERKEILILSLRDGTAKEVGLEG